MDSQKIPADCIVFDTETTGFSVEEGDRLVEIGAVRMRGGLPTNETFHRYINPARTVPKDAVDVHGLTTEFLADKPMFEEIAGDFVEFVGDLPLVAHNAKFDEKFINFELAQIGQKTYPKSRFVDTIPIAKKKFPGQQVNLDALCRRLGIDNSHRELHCALLDTEILADVYLLMTGGQTKLKLASSGGSETDSTAIRRVQRKTNKLKVIKASADELTQHEARLDIVEKAGGKCLWRPNVDEVS